MSGCAVVDDVLAWICMDTIGSCINTGSLTLKHDKANIDWLSLKPLS